MLEILTAESGAPTAKLDGRYLHSPRDPEREARRTVASVARREPPCVVFLGMGLGYSVDALLELTEETRILVFEPDQELQAAPQVARNVSYGDLRERLVVCSTPEKLSEALALYAASGFEVLQLNARRLAAPESFEEADSVIEQFRSRVDINRNTLARFAHLWVRNLCRNLDRLAEGLPLSALAGAFRGVPGLLLAAGPGLDQVLAHLPELAERSVVVAVDTAVGPALSCGVRPDVAVVVDPQYWNSRHLDGIRPDSTILLAESSTHPSVFRHFRSPAVFCGSLFPLGQEVEAALGPLGSLGTGGSVSTTAWDLLRHFGCDEIYVAGLDLGFPGGRTHFRGSFFETLAVSLGRRLSPAEGTLHRYVRSGAPFQTAATGGGTVLTDRRMEIYRTWFARKLSDQGTPATHTLSLGGARIPGLEPQPLDRLLAKPVARARIDEVFRRFPGLDQDLVRNRRNGMLTRLRTLAGNLKELQHAARAALEEVVRLENGNRSGQQIDFGRLTEIDDRIQSLGGRGIASFLMQEAISSIRSGFGSADIAEQIDASRKLYGQLEDSARFHIGIIDRYVASE